MKGLGTVSLIWSRQYFVLKTDITFGLHLVGARSARCVVAGHIGTGGTYYMNGARYIEGGRRRGPDQRRDGERPTADKHTGSHPPAMEQNVVI